MTPGEQAMAALMAVRQLLVEVQGLLAEVCQQLDAHGFEQASRSQKVSHLSNKWESPQDWLPRYLYRWLRSEAHPGVLLVLVVHLEQDADDRFPPEPWVVLGAYRGTALPPTDGSPLDDKTAETWAAGLHVEGEADDAPGDVVRVPHEVGDRLSLAVPLYGLQGPADVADRLIRPLLAAL